ncbi:MAG TPA: histidine kinase [Acidimicrobiia bacterium]|jgi:signal transduction histidine kinase|nr:histidine kinase [Acidimicrobiia bacterium]
MQAAPAPWVSRVHRTVIIGQWVALTVGIISSLIAFGGTRNTLGAVAIAAAYVIGSTLIPEPMFRIRFGVETICLTGAIVVLVAMTMTGGASSPYLLLSMGPPIFATLYGGLRPGVTTAVLSGSLLVLVTLASGEPVIDTTPALALYLVFVLLVSVIRRLLEDIHTQATTLAVEKATATEQLMRLEETHGALLKLSEDVSTGRFNAIEVGADTLERILERFPGSSGTLAINGENGSVVLASRGIPDPNGHVYTLPLSTSDTEVGTLELTTTDPLGPRELAETAAIIHPVSVAFANLQLLQDIVGSAVAEERMRLAREMHDEIGPSLASLGLALDMTAMQQANNPEVAADLQVLRSNVTKLVEDVRASVADLRNAPGPTLTARILQAVSTLEDEPQIIVDLEERRPPRPALIGDLTSIITEAARNAHQHSQASKIVISGHVDRSYGSCMVVDDGVGFDPDHEPEGHFGLIGMRERASKVGATIKFESKPGIGTAVTVEWGSR